ncbi:coproporphyrinogen oxidase [Mariniphaga anaerophila]|uniref:coproporphyrinogen oxidase n=1 Tax=Mariniphaga anaerophila TaxID=1484053 RepID=A0A1M5EJ92_9BACT|nr:oxygen-dependent coproporphyrinogen oxidase [Mariniphaga anaerophila]SHF79204.1 coproporphyrinogen oxidase [Mariniphaga anaerophila]
MDKIQHIAETYQTLQQEICNSLEKADGKGVFSRNQWKKEIGGGTTAVIEKGNIIEKGAVNFSFVKGKMTPQMENLLGEKAQNYAATGISSILHPENPWMPIIHMNVRYFAVDNNISWFGGGIDLTPHIANPEDSAAFHLALKNTCDKFNTGFYPEFKLWADNYYYLPHRNETRGVGGIFFDRLKPGQPVEFDKLFEFTVSLAKLYPAVYTGFMKKYGSRPYSERQKKWQALRRGRYVEFNLINDRGTKFGLESGGNTESILTSLPANAAWEYNYSPESGSFEEETLNLLKKGIDWIHFKPEPK